MTSLLLHFSKSEIDDLLVLERGEGAYVFDTDGRRYIDALSSLFCAQIGYSHGEEMAAAATRQLTTLAFNTNWGTAHPAALELAERLADVAPGDLNRVFFTSGGSESVEAAWKLCREYHLANGQPQRTKAIARDVAYHGVTLGALSFTGVERFKSPFGRAPIDVTHVSNTNAFRAPDGDDPEAFCRRLLDELEAAILAAGADEVALIIAEPVQNSGGCLVPPPGYWRGLRELADRSRPEDPVSTVQLETIQHHIAGADTAGTSTRTGPVYDPATGYVQRSVLLAEPADVDAAVQAAKQAFASWSNVSVTRRARVMFAFRELVMQHTDELARMISTEHGKTFEDAKGEVIRGMEVVEYACGIAQLTKGEFSDQVSTDVDLHSFRQPLGVCAGITPFNFPIMVPMWMHPVAIATGNTFVLKPSERDPSVSNYVANLYAEAGLPDGVFNVVHGDKVAVDALLAHPDVAAISFVGSTPIAKYIYERATFAGKRVQALGGAKNHAVVLPDADLDFAADHLSAAGYGSAGQRCMAISVAVAVGDAADELVERLRQKALAVKVGPGLDPDSEMGPVVTDAARDRITGYIADTQADVIVDGRELEIDGDGFWVGPTLLDKVTADMPVYTDEIFGPVLAVVRVDTLDQAIDLINANSFANGTAIFTGSGQAARTFQRHVQVGMIGVNVPIPVPMAFYSFGGWKQSLFGDHHIHGPEGVRFYTRAKAVTTRWPEDAQDASHHRGHMHFPTAV